ncbi:hypothetical protein [Thermus scotoductus]|uniref:Uncharacterized protein n=1 Tax=Thermus scotoductus (strain ATCC 700910 / SA-01) TaxID=743525 RepID=E8PL05_THESS|nr:hypothetical protein [Thermus scotoductus]ADW22229.1 hypothetical protein TSC_c16140 [Thermus scotoductus SA-01]
MKLSELVPHYPVEIEVLLQNGEKKELTAGNLKELKEAVQNHAGEAIYILISYTDFEAEREEYRISRTTFVFVEYRREHDQEHNHRSKTGQRRTGSLRR